MEQVLERHVKDGRDEFLVKWIGYPLNEATWEPFENLSGQEACEYLYSYSFFYLMTFLGRNSHNLF